jgi:hypothetical protein
MHPTNPISEPVYTLNELAAVLKVCRDTARKLVIDEPEVIRIGHPTRRNRRSYLTLRIPESVVRRVVARLTLGGRAA